tara:strand:- start:32 stop:835 length:804 start_codon:yes stop_codon:yes gene_type:complete
MENVLKKIIDKKKDKIKLYKKLQSENNILKNIKDIKNFCNFKDEISKQNSQKKISIIAEIKKASPSAGQILKNFNAIDIAKIYINNGAKCLSVLAEEDFFFGKLDYIKNIKINYKIPILCKDFFIDTYQVPLAKSYGSDCILIILSAVDKMLANDLYQAANDLNISTLIEVHTADEAEMALSFENSLIGINNRNLKNLKISLQTSVTLSKILMSHKNPLICESGINSAEDIKFIINEAKIYNFLIGESLLKSEDIGLKLKQLSQISL